MLRTARLLAALRPACAGASTALQLSAPPLAQAITQLQGRLAQAPCALWTAQSTFDSRSPFSALPVAPAAAAEQRKEAGPLHAPQTAAGHAHVGAGQQVGASTGGSDQQGQGRAGRGSLLQQERLFKMVGAAVAGASFCLLVSRCRNSARIRAES